jgi:GH15 family glucan-1,4-alpha-glucosidase
VRIENETAVDPLPAGEVSQGAGPATASASRQGPQAGPLDLGLIGNGRTAALVDTKGRILWWCFPRFDGDPVFSRLLAGEEEKGFADIVLANQVASTAAYEQNTAVIVTTLTDSSGNAVRITDFAPRFQQFGRIHHPAQLVRRIEPIRGLPRITLRVRPTFNYGRPAERQVAGSNHIRYSGGRDVMRLTTDAPLSYVTQEAPFVLTRPVTLIFGPDEPFEGWIEATGRTFEDRTRDYWQNWVRTLTVPYEWQEPVIRAAITLKLCSFDETGAIIAAHTTSVPEAPGSSRNWDYRYCWLRDAYFVVQALNRLGKTDQMVAFLDYILTLAVEQDAPLKPVYSIVHDEPLDERIAEDLAGFLGNGPVRVGNQAVEQIQHDVYGSAILAAAQMFIDDRLARRGDKALFERLEPLGRQAARLALEPDAGIWEYRGRTRIHTHSAALCWVACDRLARIARRLGLNERATDWREQADRLRREILARAWDEKRGAIVGAFGQPDLDASVLLLAELGLIAPQDPRFVATVRTIGRELMRGGHLMRYTAADDFGLPESAFLVCRFWYVDALALIGAREEARDLFCDVVRHRNPFGLLSEDIHPVTGQLWGNIPQTYSMAGLVLSAMRLSRSWEDAWCHD